MKSKVHGVLLSVLMPLLVACNGGSDNSANDENSNNQAPIAISGINQNVKTGDVVKLDGSNSVDKDQDLITYQWVIQSKPDNSEATLKNAQTVLPEFTADKSGTYIIELVVHDGKVASRPNQVKIVAISQSENSAPVANAGADSSASLVRMALLLGTQTTDADGDELYYYWELIGQPENSAPELSFQTSSNIASMTTDVAGDYVVKLTVSDGKAFSSDTVKVTFYYENVPPVSGVNNSMIALVGASVPLDGSSSFDANDDPLMYQWSVTSKPNNSNVTIDNPMIEKTSFTGDVPGVYQFSLIVDDGELQSTPNSLAVRVVSPQAPHTRLLVGDESEPQILPYRQQFVVDKTSETGEISESYILGRYAIEAVGKDVTISGIRAEDASGNIVPYFQGLSAGNTQVVRKGDRLTFDLVAPATGGKQSELHFSFVWSLNGPNDFSMQERFTVSYQFISR
ncbi:PKD domain-containing protein [Vibrio sp. Of7-15]|uniref:PKD domain-containing protein n=1 Tax=Vibrio sp. Of7-15 TaxID=2724879 RepID=UPI001EF1E09A|nr:PKD domain-containing protein [Vibrio sp. Of7-15]MCG7499663.1 PKD domain-containing protein [Vibrio sp. Of7-15]